MLPRVSRTFALNIRILPAPLQDVVRQAYLFCRMADTLEDSRALAPAHKVELLQAFAGFFPYRHGHLQSVQEWSRAFVGLDAAGADDVLCRNAEQVFRAFADEVEALRAPVDACVHEMALGMRDFARRRLTSPRGVLQLEDGERVRYFHGMLRTERDFQEEQLYHQEKRKLANRMLHGWGVVCGLGVKPTKPDSSKVIITPGMALDCLGNEIVVCNDFEVDLKKLPSLCPDTSAGDKDPCAERQTEVCKYYIGIKYTEAPTDPVAVYLPGGSCEEKTCEYSRTREGFCVNLFKSPPCYAVLPKDGLFQDVVDCTKGDASNEDKLKCVAKVIDATEATRAGWDIT